MNVERLNKALLSIKEASNKLEDILKRLAKGMNIKDHYNDIWTAYVKVEYSVILTKLSVGDGSSVRHTGLIRDGRPEDYLVSAYDLLTSVSKKIRLKDYQKALSELREARDKLKQVLIELQKKKV